jgi:hypothetical protein
MNALPESTEAPISSDKLVRTSRGRGGRLVYKPLIRPNGVSRYEIRGQREDKSIIAWGFWGGLIVVVVSVLLILSAQSVYNVWDLLWGLVALSFGIFLYRYGKRTSLREEVLCEVDLERQTFSWPTVRREDKAGQQAGQQADKQAGEQAIQQQGQHAGELVAHFDEITEIVFGMTDFPLSESNQDVQVHAFSLLIRDDNDRLIPVVEATPHKEEAHTIAKILGNELQMGITYVGKGIQ